ncbi:MAG: sugar phosphate isomerase/epimerase [Firmicutes bacterium]|nr:sugar phosphate isomerase/epimerase [Bacillota bacterium]
MKKSINAWSMPKELTFEECFIAAKEAGFDGIEFNVDVPGGHGLTMDITEEQLADIKALSVKYELPVVSISSSMHAGRIGAPCDKDNEEVKEVIRKQIQCAKALDAGAVLVVPGAPLKENSWKAMRARAIQTLKEMADEIEASGIVVGLENVWNGFFMSPFDMRSFIEEIGSPNIKAYFDVGNVAAFSFPEHWIEVLADQICRIHVKGYRSEGLNRGGEWVDLMDGTIDWQKVVDAFKAIGWDGYLTAEVFPVHPYDDMNEFYRETVRDLGKIIELA